MNNVEQFFRVAELHTDLVHIDTLLHDLGLALTRSGVDGGLAYRSDQPLPSDGRNDERAAMREREAELLELRENAVSRLLPQFVRLAELEVSRLDDEMEAESGEILSGQCVAVFDTVLRAYVLRLVRAFEKWNDAIEPLIQFSQGLPASDEQEVLPKVGQDVRRIGPDARGRYTGIKVFGRRLELIDVEAEAEKFLSALESKLMRLLDEGREHVRTESSPRDGY